MSAAAEDLRKSRRDWALPHSRWDRFAAAMRVALPAAAAVLLAIGLVWPMTQDQEFSFILSKDEVDMAGDRMRLDEAVYRGKDDLGRPFLIRARSGVQQTSADPRLVLSGLSARLQMEEGLARVAGDQGVYDLEAETLFVDGPVQVTRTDGYRLVTGDMLVDIPARSMVGRGRVEGVHPLGRFEGDELKVDLGSRVVTLDGNTKMRINP
ncbi:hypothetical protein [Pacificimonas flava]|uniref:LPS export ABC transporter periplasmic protein LptC n=1 Tax=Pacificimonas flava TaxID=1234595 RepID=M2SBJ6_9SPHN|nr:hypothetical protein [Pacificimonas flava]EMD82745.1 hypothetical protein C725_1785 [Pacificimonas flava]MBB5279364.1 lipopolysaccharide export system protein LptC [Pacificimonas flava]